MSFMTDTDPDHALGEELFNEDLFDQRTEDMGATTERQKAKLAGIGRATLDRWRHRGVEPQRRTLRRVALRLEVPVADLIKRGD